MTKELLQKMGEETIYTAKGHFKSADYNRICTRSLLLLSLVADVVGLLIEGNWGTALNLAGIVSAVILLVKDAEDGKDQRRKHQFLANKYLSLHKKLRSAFYNPNISEGDIQQLQLACEQLDTQKKNPDISLIPRIWAKWAIESWHETDEWWRISNK